MRPSRWGRMADEGVKVMYLDMWKETYHLWKSRIWGHGDKLRGARHLVRLAHSANIPCDGERRIISNRKLNDLCRGVDGARSRCSRATACSNWERGSVARRRRKMGVKSGEILLTQIKDLKKKQNGKKGLKGSFRTFVGGTEGKVAKGTEKSILNKGTIQGESGIGFR